MGFISLWLKNDGEKSKQKIILQCYRTKFKTYTNTLLVFWTTQSRTTLPYINITYLTKANSLLSSKEWIWFKCCLISSWGVEILNQTLLYNYLWTAPTIFSMTKWTAFLSLCTHYCYNKTKTPASALLFSKTSSIQQGLKILDCIYYTVA